MNRIHRLIGTPVLTQVRLEPVNVDWVSDSLAPKRLPDLFADRPVVLYGRHLAGDGPLRMRIHALDAAGKPWCEELVGRPGPAPMLISTWGRAMVRDLEDEYSSGGARDANKLMQRIVDVSLESHVLSRFTAYVAVDQAEVIPQGGQLQQIVQPVEMPQGWVISARQVCLGAFAPRSMGLLSRKRSDPPEIAMSLSEPGDSDSADSLLQEFTDTAISFSESTASCLGRIDEESGPVVQLVELLITEAIRLGATEIRIEPLADRLRVQYRIRGQLVDREAPPLPLLDVILGRIIKLANLDLTQRHSPQQGQVSLVIDSTTYVWDVSTSKTSFGTSIVMTLNPQGAKDNKKQEREKSSPKKFWT